MTRLKPGYAAARALALGGAISLVLVGCPLLGDRSVDSGTTLRIMIQSPAMTQGISSSEYNVVSLDLTVSAFADSSVVFSENWTPAAGATQYDVSVPGAGAYDFRVVHNGESGGNTIAATEAVTVTLQPLTISVVTVIPGQIGVIVVGETGVFGASRFGQAFFGS